MDRFTRDLCEISLRCVKLYYFTGRFPSRISCTQLKGHRDGEILLVARVDDSSDNKTNSETNRSLIAR